MEEHIMGVSPTEIEKYLKDEKYPVKKEELVRHAQEHGAPTEVLQTLEQLPRESFEKPTDVSQAMGEIQ